MELCHDVLQTYDSKYVPVVPCAPECVKRVGNILQGKLPYDIDSPSETYTLKFYYALQFWLMTVAIFEEKSTIAYRNNVSYNWLFEWVDKGSFRELISKNERYELIVKEFGETLEEIADSKVITVIDGIRMSHNRKRTSNATDLGVETQFIIDEETIHSSIIESNLFYYPYKYKPVSYSWNDINDYFVELSLKQMALLDGEKLNKHNKVDDSLFEACCNFDLEQVRSALKNGADVNALNDEGQSPLTAMIENIQFNSLDDCQNVNDGTYDRLFAEAREKYKAKARPVIGLLMKKKADVSLFGYACGDALRECALSHDYDLMKFLLENGADPNFNTDIYDLVGCGFGYSICSSVLDCALDEDWKYHNENTPRILELMEQYKAKLNVDDTEPYKNN